MKKYSAYKDSGIEWIGEIPEHWSEYRLKTLISNNNNGVWGNEANNDGADLVCVRVADFDLTNFGVAANNLTYRNIPHNQQEGRLLTKSNLLIEKSGGGDNQPVGRVVKYDLDYKAVCSNFIAKLELEDFSNPQYMVYFFNFLYSVRVNNRAIKQTTGIQNLDTKLYFNERIFLPPLPEQTAIANFLDHKTRQIDELITKKERLIELLKEERTAIINHAVTKGLDPKVPMKDSWIEWLGKIPEHWEKRRLASLGRFSKGSGISRNEILPDGIPCIRYGEIYTEYNRIVTKPISYISKESSEKSERVQKGTVLFTASGETLDEIGKSVVYYGEEDIYVGGDIIIFKLKPIISALFVSYLMQCDFVNQQKSRFGRGGIIVHIYPRQLREILIPLPPNEEQTSIVNFLDYKTKQLDDQTQLVKKEIELLKEYKTALINETVTGKIDVRDKK